MSFLNLEVELIGHWWYNKHSFHESVLVFISCCAVQFIGLIVVFIYAVVGLQFFADRAQVNT
jgi:hypothetical protein